MKPLAILLSLWLAVPALGQTPPVVPKVIFPAVPTPKPIPPPNPSQAVLIGADQQYVVQSSAPIIVLASPQGVVKITPEVGPLRIRGKFVDGTGTETRTFSQPNIYIVEASGAGVCELIVVKSMDPKTVDRLALTTEVKPPEPKPPEPKPPEPKPDNPIPSEKLRVLCIWETGKTLTSPQAGVLNSIIWKSEVIAAGGEERVFDQHNAVDLTGADKFWTDAMKRTKASVPWVIMSSPKGFYEGPLPSSVADMQAQIKKVMGG